MEKSENTGLFSDFFYQLRFRPAVHQYRSSGLVSRRSAGGKEIFMNIVGVFDFSRSVRTADHPRVWQHGGANETLDSRSASRCPLHSGHAVFSSNPLPLPEGRRTQTALVLQPIAIGRVRRCRSPSTGPQGPIRHSC